MSLLLFYSVNCGHCRMLLDSVNRHDKNKIVKLVCIESLISENRLPPQIHSVPAMMVILEKKFLYGKNVFDYLLLPGTGKLVQQGGGQENNALKNVANNSIAPNKPANTSEADEPLGFSISLNGMSDRFSLIDDETADEFGNNDRQYNWASLTTDTQPPSDPAYLTVNADARTKKELPSLADLQELRALDMAKPDSMNPNNMPIATSSR